MKTASIFISTLLFTGLAYGQIISEYNGQEYTCPAGYDSHLQVNGDNVNHQCIPESSTNTNQQAQTQRSQSQLTAQEQINRLRLELSQTRRQLEAAQLRYRNTLVSQGCTTDSTHTNTKTSMNNNTSIPSTASDEMADLRRQHNCPENHNISVINGEVTCSAEELNVSVSF